MTYDRIYPILTELCEGLSFGARAALCCLHAITYEMQKRDVRQSWCAKSLGLSEVAWADLSGELFLADAAVAVVLPDGDLGIRVKCPEALLMIAMGVPGRPRKSDWDQLRQLVIEEKGAACLYCGAEGIELEIDHVVPVTKGGSNHMANLVPACKACNSSKGARHLHDWRPSGLP